MSSLEGAVVVVTGSARGIGRAIAEELGQGGAKVVVNYANSKGPAEDLVAHLQKSGSPESVAIRGRIRSRAGSQAHRGDYPEVWPDRCAG